MNKYTRREFFKSIIPVSVGVVSLLGSNKLNNNKFLELEKPTKASLVSEVEYVEYIGNATFQIDGKEFYTPVYSRNAHGIMSGISWREIE